MVRGEPAGEGAVTLPQLEDASRVGDGRVDLEPVADDVGVGEEAATIGRAVRGHHLGDEVAVGSSERVALPEDGEPGKARLVDLQDQPLEERGIVPQREAVLPVVVGPMPFMSGGGIAVGLGHGIGRRLRFGFYSVASQYHEPPRDGVKQDWPSTSETFASNSSAV